MLCRFGVIWLLVGMHILCAIPCPAPGRPLNGMTARKAAVEDVLAACRRILRVMGRGRLDAIAVAASVLAVAMVVVYLAVIRQQEGEPAAWAVAVLIGGAAAAAYGAVVAAPYRRAALVLAGLALLALGLLAILTIGLPILMAGALCLLAAVRQSPLRAP